MLKFKNIALVFILFQGLDLQAQYTESETPTTRILFVFDGSGSMHGRWQSGKKIDVAQRLMTKMLDSLQSLNNPHLQLALRVYGHTKPSPPQDCNDTHLEVPFSNGNIPRIKRVLRSLIPKGTTPIARSLQRAGTDFPACDNCRNIIILITDGIEECGEDPCAVSRVLQKQGILLKPFVIGIGLDPEFRATFECVGTYFDAASEETFRNVLDVVISQALNNTTAQINLLNENRIPSETNVPIALYNRTSGKLEESFVHTLNASGHPDTLILDPLMTYKMTVFTLPPVHVDSISLVPGTHNHIGASTPQGQLELKTNIGRNVETPKAIIRRHNQTETIHVQNFNTEQRYLTGSYDLEILTLPRIVQKNIQIDQSTTTTVAIPAPGVAMISVNSHGFGGIYFLNGDKLEWVVDLNPSSIRQSFNLQPGNYMVIYRPKSAQFTSYSRSESFSISSGASTLVNLK